MRRAGDTSGDTWPVDVLTNGNRANSGDAVFEAFLRRFQSPVLTRPRVRLAYAIAVTTDVIQLLLGPFGWAFADELLDVTAMILT